MLHVLNDEKQFDELIQSGAPFIIFKHSTRCSISNHGCDEVYKTIESLGLENIYMIDVLNQRNVAIYVAACSNIRHESPQIIFFDKGKAYANGSHGQVNERNIKHILGGGRAGK